MTSDARGAHQAPEIELADLGTDVEWPDSAASSALRDRLAAEPGLGRLGELAGWVVGVRPTGSDFARVRVVVVGAAPTDLVTDTAAAVGGAGVRGLPADGSVATGAARADEEIDSG